MGYWNGDSSLNDLSAIVVNSPESIGSLFIGAGAGSPSNGNWPVANKAYFIPFVVVQRSIARKALWAAAIGSGNIDVGIYNAQGVRLTSSGSVAENGNPQTIDFTDVTLYPGIQYFMAGSRSGTGGVLSMVGFNDQYQARYLGVRQMLSAFPLPATAVFAQMTDNVVPGMGILFEAITI